MTSWNKYTDAVLKKWSSMSKTYSTMHSKSADYYTNLERRFGVPVILLGAIASSSIFSSSGNNIWGYVNGVMVLVMTGLSGIDRFLGTHEKREKHIAAAFKYTHIAMDIDTLLSFPRGERDETPSIFINQIKTSILEVREHSPNLPTWIVSSYINKLDKSITDTHTIVNASIDPYIQLRNLNELNKTSITSESDVVDNKEKKTKNGSIVIDVKEVLNTPLSRKKSIDMYINEFNDNVTTQVMKLSDKLERDCSDIETDVEV